MQKSYLLIWQLLKNKILSVLSLHSIIYKFRWQMIENFMFDEKNYRVAKHDPSASV